MAYGFGTTVNPQLGAVDYSDYLRGALTGAQMQAQGTAAIGQGIQSALGSIGKAAAAYITEKKKNELEEQGATRLQNLATENPWLAKAVGIPETEIENKEMWMSVSKELGGPANVINFANAADNLITENDAYEYAQFLSTLAPGETPEAPGISDRAQRMGESIFTQSKQAKATLAATELPVKTQQQVTDALGKFNAPPQEGAVRNPVQLANNLSRGASPAVRKALFEAAQEEINNELPYAIDAIRSNLDAGGTLDENPAGFSDDALMRARYDVGIRNLAKDKGQEVSDDAAATVITNSMGGTIDAVGISKLNPQQRLQVYNELAKISPELTARRVDIAPGITGTMLGSTFIADKDRDVNLGPAATQAMSRVAKIASENPIKVKDKNGESIYVAPDWVDLTPELKTQVAKEIVNFFGAANLKKEIADPQAIINFYNSAKDTSPLGVGTAPPPIVPASGPYPGPQAASSPLGSIFGGVNQQPAATQTAATQPTTVRPDSSGANFINPAATTPASRPGIEQGFFSPPSYSDSAPLSVTSITPAPTAPGEPSPGQFSTERLTAPPIETSVSATGEPYSGAADGGGGYDAQSVVSKAVTGATVVEAARRVFKNQSVKSSLAPARAAMRLTSAKTKDIVKELLKTSGRTTLRRAGAIGAVTVAVDDILGMGVTFIANKARKSEGRELRDYNTGLIEITMEKLGELSVDPRGNQVIEGRILDEIESIQRSRVGNRDADAEKNAQIRYLLELSQRVNTAGFRSGEGKKYSR